MSSEPPADGRLRFRPRARIIRSIGDQLISGPEAAVIELVKNAYDADAEQVSITFTPPLKAGAGRITVSDDGHGMELADIRDKWMEPATSTKARDRRSRSGRRLMMGSKGIGRFAAAKLGSRMMLRSVTGGDDDRSEIIVGEIDWSIFSGEAYLSDIAIDCLTQASEGAPGTEIEILDLVEDWTEKRLKDLLQELRRLVSPFQTQDGDPFRILLDLSACTRLAVGFDGDQIVSGPDADDEGATAHLVLPFPLLTACDYVVEGAFDDWGTFRGSMEIRRGGLGPVSIELAVPILDGEDDCGGVGVKFFIFDREVEALKANMSEAGLGAVSAAEARRMLDNVAGIAVYRDGFRVRPYGDLQTDWLMLDRSRVQDPSLHLGHNQIAGYVTVESQDAGRLIERSSREGFEDNGAYRRLQRFLRELLAQEIEPRRQVFRDGAGIARKHRTSFEEVRSLADLKKLRLLVAGFAAEDRAAAEAVLDQTTAQLNDRIGALEDRQRILEAKSSLGNIVGEVLHEGTGPAGYVATTSGRLQRLWFDIVQNGARADMARQDFPNKLALMKESGQRLSDLFEMLRPLAGGKRGAPRYISPGSIVNSAKGLFEAHGISIETVRALDCPDVIGFPGDLSTAVVNLLSNSVHWLEQKRVDSPRILIEFTWDAAEVRISVEDNGPGIPAEFVDQIFDVGFTLKVDGTGLGLNIAREALARSGAVLAYDREFTGGARFLIIFERDKAR